MKAKPRYYRSAFTLIELLVVIAIIIVLAMITVPVISSVRNSAHASQCAMNLRQQGVAFISFAADNENRFPLGFSNVNEPGNNWYYRISPYLGLEMERKWDSVISNTSKDGSPLRCPVFSPTDPVVAPWVSYKISQAHWVWLQANGYPPEGEAAGGMGVPISAIQNPAKSMLVAEGRAHVVFYRPGETPPAEGLVYPHSGKINALFADGHVDSFTEKELQDRWEQFYRRAID